MEPELDFIDDENTKWMLTPKGIFIAALHDVGLIDDIEDKRANGAWRIFQLLMERNGYVEGQE
jgi:hypothetical protein